MHQALYRKWRPQTFDDVRGQEHITSILRYETENRVFSHAYLFCGSRGTGKTTCAKILAKAVNCEAPVNGSPCGKCSACVAIDSGAATDVLEMDAASNNGVEDIRDIRDEVVYSPSNLRYRVYIIDEVHMLSVSAFNALLKTLEEPPPHVLFILATTELHKLPATIVSRCQRFEFRRIATDVLTSRIKYIAEQEKIAIDDDAARLIARYSQGGMRDSISLLELCASSGAKIDISAVNETIGSAGRERMMGVISSIADKNYEFLFKEIDEVVTSSKDISVFWQDLISLYRDLLVVKTVKDSAKYLDLTDFELKSLLKLSEKFSRELLMYHCRMLEDALTSMQASGAIKRMIAELCFVKMCDDSLSTSNEALLLRISKLEASLASGNFAPAKNEEAPKEEKVIPQKVEKKAEKPEDYEKADKQNAPNDTKQITFEKEPARQVTRQAVASDAKSTKPLKAWSEAVQSIESVDKGACAFLKMTRAYLAEDNRVHVLCDGFILYAMDKPEIKKALAASLSKYLERAFTEHDIVFEQDSGKIKLEEDNSDLDAFDDFLNN